jgi:hypothetical protein
MAFKMKGYSPFTAKKTKKTKNAKPEPASAMFEASTNSMLMKKDPSAMKAVVVGGPSGMGAGFKGKDLRKKSPMKLKTVPAIPRKGKKSPADRVADLTAKEKAGTITSTEKRELRKLRRSMERGPGSYGREMYDKE